MYDKCDNCEKQFPPDQLVVQAAGDWPERRFCNGCIKACTAADHESHWCIVCTDVMEEPAA